MRVGMSHRKTLPAVRLGSFPHTCRNELVTPGFPVYMGISQRKGVPPN